MVVVVVVVVVAAAMVVVVVALELRRLGFGFRTGREATRVNKLLPLLLLPGWRKGWPRASEGWRRETTEKRDGYTVPISGVADVKLEKPENLDDPSFPLSPSLSLFLGTHVRKDAPGRVLTPFFPKDTRVMRETAGANAKYAC